MGSIAQFWQEILVEVYIIYGAMVPWLEDRFTKPEVPGSKP